VVHNFRLHLSSSLAVAHSLSLYTNFELRPSHQCHCHAHLDRPLHALTMRKRYRRGSTSAKGHAFPLTRITSPSKRGTTETPFTGVTTGRRCAGNA